MSLTIPVSTFGKSSPVTATPELIQSAPSETDLAHPALRHAKDAWMEMINGAKQTIDVAQFYASSTKGTALEPIIHALEGAGERGVKIRFLLSNELLGEYAETFERLKKIKGAEFRVYDISKLTGGILHAKYWIIDGREVFIGSQNFDWRALTEIHELGLRIPSPSAAKKLGAIFETDWSIAGSGKAPMAMPPTNDAPKNDGIEIVASPPIWNPPGIRAAEKALLELIDSAKETLDIQLLHYSPQEGKTYWPVIDQAIRAASARGVRVRMILSHWNLRAPGGSHAQSLAVLPNVDLRVVEIPVSRSRGFVPFSRVIHSKYMLVDGKTLWLGTSNWSQDYFHRSRNVEILAHRPELARAAGEIFMKLWSSSYGKDVLAYKLDEWKEFNPAKAPK